MRWPGNAWRRRGVAVVKPALCAILPLCVLSGCEADGSDACQAGDADGVVGGHYTFHVTVDDDAFKPVILKGQNTAEITLVLTNAGTVPHGFGVRCIATPNDTGCPTKSCFPDETTIDPIEPGKMATTEFKLPLVEGIYPIYSTADGDTHEAQFVVQ
jgi:hypothetical protein